MFGVMMAMMLSVGGAATVLTVIARRNAPGEGWREALNSAVHRGQEADEVGSSADLPSEEDVSTDDAAVGGVDELFEIAEAPPEPAYSEASLVRHYLDRMSPTVVRWTAPAVAKVTPQVQRVSPVVTRWSALAQARIEPALDKLRH
jgi:hypothetical protein